LYYSLFNIGDHWVLQETGEHCHSILDISAGTLGKSAGMHTKFRDEVDRLLKIGLTPTKVLISIQQLALSPGYVEYRNVIPSIKQIVNRKKVLGRLGGFNIDVIADLQVLYFSLLALLL